MWREPESVLDSKRQIVLSFVVLIREYIFFVVVLLIGAVLTTVRQQLQLGVVTLQQRVNQLPPFAIFQIFQVSKVTVVE